MSGIMADLVPARTAVASKSWPYLLGRLVVTRFQSFQLAVLMLMAINVFYGLSDSVVSDMDESRYGVAASEMLRKNDWLVPTYAGEAEYWNLKPPLGYWLIQGSYALFGRSTMSLRLPSALCALGVVFLTMQIGLKWYNRRIAILAGLFVATCFGFLSHHGARSGDLDAALTLISLLLLRLVPGLYDSSRDRLLFGLLCAAGFLLKSFAILPFILATAVYLVWIDGRKLNWREWLPALGVIVAIVGGWAVMRTIRDGTPHFVIRMFYEDLLMRATQEIDGGSSYAPWGYFTSLFDRFAPWPLYLVIGCIHYVRNASTRGGINRLKQARRLVVVWGALPLCLFSLAHTHHHWYLDPIYPAFAILTGVAVLRIFEHQSTELKKSLVVGLAIVSLVACEARVIARCFYNDRMPRSQIFLATLGKYNRDRRIPLYVAFHLSHSERFLLQVVCGYDVREQPPSVSATYAHKESRPGLTLYRLTELRDAAKIKAATAGVLVEHENFILVTHAKVHGLRTNRASKWLPAQTQARATKSEPVV